MCNADPYSAKQKELKAAGVSTGRKLSSIETMKEYQNRYYEDVGFFHGQARLGPKRRRLSRQQWKDEQTVNELAANCVNRTNARTAKAEKHTALSKKMVAGLISGLAVVKNKDYDKLKAENTALKTTIAEQETLIGMVTGLGNDTAPSKYVSSSCTDGSCEAFTAPLSDFDESSHTNPSPGIISTSQL